MRNFVGFVSGEPDEDGALLDILRTVVRGILQTDQEFDWYGSARTIAILRDETVTSGDPQTLSVPAASVLSP